jgi:hypothetical protein
MLRILLPHAVSHPEILRQRSVRMKQNITTKQGQKQIELFFEMGLTSNPIFLELPMARLAELEKALAQLLLNAARGDTKVVGGIDRDE